METGQLIDFVTVGTTALTIDFCYVMKCGEGIVALGLEMDQRRVRIIGSGSEDDGTPLLCLMPHKGRKALEVRFPAFKGWDVWSANVCKDQIMFTLIGP